MELFTHFYKIDMSTYLLQALGLVLVGTDRNMITIIVVRGRGSSIGRACDVWSGGRGFDPRSVGLLPTGWVGVSVM